MTHKNELGFFNYKGKLVERLIGGYRWGDEKFLTLEMLDEHFDKINKKFGENWIGGTVVGKKEVK